MIGSICVAFNWKGPFFDDSRVKDESSKGRAKNQNNNTCQRFYRGLSAFVFAGGWSRPEAGSESRRACVALIAHAFVCGEVICRPLLKVGDTQ